MSVDGIRSNIMSPTISTAISAAAMAGVNTAKQPALFEAAKEATHKYLDLKHTANVSPKDLANAKSKFKTAGHKYLSTRNSKMTKLHNWLEKPFEFFAKGGEKIAATSPKLSQVATNLGAKAATFKPGVLGNIQKYSVKAAEYAVKGSNKVVSGTGSALKFLSKPGVAGKTGIFAGAFEAIFRAPELIQGLKEGRRVDAVGSYATKVGGTAAAAAAGAKLGFQIGSKGGFWAGIAGTLAGIGISMAGSWVADKGADIVFGKNKGTAKVASGYVPPEATNTTNAKANNQPGFNANTFDAQKELSDLIQMGLIGNANGLGFNGTMDYPIMMNIYS